MKYSDLVGESWLGMDPEAFVAYDGKWVPAHILGLPPKNKPHYCGEEGFLLRDGYAVEFNPSAEGCRGLLDAGLRTLISHVQECYAPKSKHSLVFQSAIEIDLSTLKGAPVDVSEFGCEGAWNTYLKRVVKPKIHGPTHPYRYAGGHMHGSFWQGFTVPWAKSMDTTFHLIKIMDRYVGQLDTYLTGSHLTGLRRKYYGQAGEFRIQNHEGTAAAIEYRTPSAEIMSHHALVNLMFGVFRTILENYEAFAEVYDPKYEEQVRGIINNGESRNDCLDVLPELPGWYDHKTLKRARGYFRRYLHANQLRRWQKDHYASESMRGWGELASTLGFSHDDSYRAGHDQW